jgi:hypothetical protein
VYEFPRLFLFFFLDVIPFFCLRPLILRLKSLIAGWQLPLLRRQEFFSMIWMRSPPRPGTVVPPLLLLPQQMRSLRLLSPLTRPPHP